MEVDAFMALMRLTLNSDKVVANLAHMALNLAKGIRDAETRAEFAEAALAAERTKISSFMDALQYNTHEDVRGLPHDYAQLVQYSRETIVMGAT